MSTTIAASNLEQTANYLDYISVIFVRCFILIIIPFGIVGHMLSIYVFTRSNLRSNPCGRYFLAASIVGMVHTCYTLPIRLVQSGYVNNDPGAYSIIFCKVIWFTNFSLRGLCPWLIVLACIDRYLISSLSATMRRHSNLRTANRLIVLTVLSAFIIYVHIPILFQIGVKSTDGQPACYPTGISNTYRFILSFFNLIYFGLLPSLSMLLLGLLTVKNIEQSKKHFMTTNNNFNTRKINRQMLRMLFVQVFVYCTTGLAYSIFTIILPILENQNPDVVQMAHERLTNAIVGMLSNTGPCLSFYLFTLSSDLFRKESKKLFCRTQRIHVDRIVKHHAACIF